MNTPSTDPKTQFLKYQNLAKIDISQFPAQNILFILPSNSEILTNLISTIIMPIKTKTFILCFWPSLTSPCEQLLKHIKNIICKSIDIGPIPLDNDVLSLEMYGLKNIFLENSLDTIRIIKGSINLLENIYGEIQIKFAKGNISSQIYDSLCTNKEKNTESECKNAIDVLILIDRECDLLTPLLNQMTYEGLIDEFLGINFGTVIDPNSYKPVNLLMDQFFYPKCRSVHFNCMKSVFEKLTSKLTLLKSQSKDSKSLDEATQYAKQVFDLKKAKLDNSLPLRNFIIKNAYK